MKRATCPSCGAPAAFRSALSIYVVCEFCRSTLLRSGEDLQNLGRMADLLEDSSRLQIGSEGTFGGRHFVIVGRIQMKYDAGFWNEWYTVSYTHLDVYKRQDIPADKTAPAILLAVISVSVGLSNAACMTY